MIEIQREICQFLFIALWKLLLQLTFKTTFGLTLHVEKKCWNTYYNLFNFFMCLLKFINLTLHFFFKYYCTNKREKYFLSAVMDLCVLCVKRVYKGIKLLLVDTVYFWKQSFSKQNRDLWCTLREKYTRFIENVSVENLFNFFSF